MQITYLNILKQGPNSYNSASWLDVKSSKPHKHTTVGIHCKIKAFQKRTIWLPLVPNHLKTEPFET